MEESRKQYWDYMNLFIVNVMHWINLLGSNVLLRENFVSFVIEVVVIFIHMTEILVTIMSLSWQEMIVS